MSKLRKLLSHIRIVETVEAIGYKLQGITGEDGKVIHDIMLILKTDGRPVLQYLIKM